MVEIRRDPAPQADMGATRPSAEARESPSPGAPAPSTPRFSVDKEGHDSTPQPETPQAISNASLEPLLDKSPLRPQALPPPKLTVLLGVYQDTLLM